MLCIDSGMHRISEIARVWALEGGGEEWGRGERGCEEKFPLFLTFCFPTFHFNSASLASHVERGGGQGVGFYVSFHLCTSCYCAWFSTIVVSA